MAFVAARLYDLIDEYRARAGMSWTDVHRKSGIARSTVLKWRTATRPPQAGTVIAVANAVGIDRDLALHLGGVIVNPALDKQLNNTGLEQRQAQLSAELNRLTRRVRQVSAELREVTAELEEIRDAQASDAQRGAADDGRTDAGRREPRQAGADGVTPCETGS